MRSVSIVVALAAFAVSTAGAQTASQPAARSAAEVAPTATDFSSRAEALINTYVRDGRFSGAVLVARDGKPILREGFGLANREWNIPVAPDTEFRLGSITKQFTATAILQLAELGKLSLDDPIGKYYPAAPKAWDKVTLRLLLSHRSGIPDYTEISGFFGGPARLDMTPEALIALTRDQPLEFEPGAKFKYDNSGYILLGYVVEKAGGQTYADYLRDHIFQPLGLTHTGYEVGADILPHRAAGYTMVKGAWKNAGYLSMTVPYAAGSLYSNVDDLLAWDQALYAAQPLRQASMDAMFTDHGEKYGYGYVVENQLGRRVWWHNGGINGFHTYLARYPDDRLTVIVLANVESSPVERIGVALARLNFGLPVEAGPKPGETAHPGTEAALRRFIDEARAGAVNYDELGKDLADLVRTQASSLKALYGQLGPLKTVTFTGADDHGVDGFKLHFENGDLACKIALDAGGRIIGAEFSKG